jgi:hypothetical protein
VSGIGGCCSDFHVHPIIRQIIEQCWKLTPKDRPSFKSILKLLETNDFPFFEDVDPSILLVNVESVMTQNRESHDSDDEQPPATKPPRSSWHTIETTSEEFTELEKLTETDTGSYVSVRRK